jgi:hypothetical protein
MMLILRSAARQYIETPCGIFAPKKIPLPILAVSEQCPNEASGGLASMAAGGIEQDGRQRCDRWVGAQSDAAKDRSFVAPINESLGTKSKLPTASAFERIASTFDAQRPGAIAGTVEIERQNRWRAIEPQSVKKLRLLRRTAGEILDDSGMRIIGFNCPRIERHAQRARLAAEIEREMWVL